MASGMGSYRVVATGVVKEFNKEDGVGVITPDDGTPDLLVDRAQFLDLDGQLYFEEGLAVTYEVELVPSVVAVLAVRRGRKRVWRDSFFEDSGKEEMEEEEEEEQEEEDEEEGRRGGADG